MLSMGMILLHIVLSVVAIDKYVRPVNEDCVAQFAGQLGDGTLFPPEWAVGGQTTPAGNGSFVTQVTSASGFTVTYYDTYKVVENAIANETYVLYQCGTNRPDASQPGMLEGAKMFEVPLTSLSVPETVPYAFVQLLGVDARVHDVTGMVTAACGQKLVECGKDSLDIYSGYLDNTTVMQNDVNPYVDGIVTTSRYNDSKVFSLNAARDPGLLNRAEWIKFLGLFFNLDKAATEIYNGIEASYNQTKAAAKQKGESTPVVAWVTHYVYKTEEHYDVSVAAYKAQAVSDANGKNVDVNEILKTYPGTQLAAFSPTTVEFAWGGNATFATKKEAQIAFYDFLSTLDAVIDETYTPDPKTYGLAEFKKEYGLDTADPAVLAKMSWLQPELIYREDGLISQSNDLDWFEGSIPRPDLVIIDVDRVVDSARQGSQLKKGEFKWVRNIDETPNVVTANDCKRLSSCNATPSTICPFVKVCGNGKTALLEYGALDSGVCQYMQCTQGSVQENISNTAQMAAPAVILLTLLIVFVEALINFC